MKTRGDVERDLLHTETGRAQMLAVRRALKDIGRPGFDFCRRAFAIFGQFPPLQFSGHFAMWKANDPLVRTAYQAAANALHICQERGCDDPAVRELSVDLAEIFDSLRFIRSHRDE